MVNLKRALKPVPEGYICKACGEGKHWIYDCKMKAKKEKPKKIVQSSAMQSLAKSIEKEGGKHMKFENDDDDDDDEEEEQKTAPVNSQNTVEYDEDGKPKIYGKNGKYEQRALKRKLKEHPGYKPPSDTKLFVSGLPFTVSTF